MKDKIPTAIDPNKVFDEKNFKIVVESLTHPFYVIDISDHSIIMANKAAGHWNRGHGQKCYMVTHGKDHPCWEDGESCPIQTVIQSGEPTVAEHVHKGPNGENRFYEVHAFPIKDDNGK